MSAAWCRITPAEDPSKLKNPENYAEDIETLSHGVKEEVTSNQIINFHFARNYYLDVMHDDSTGTCPYIIVNVLNFLIYKEKFLLIEQINHRIDTFPYTALKKSHKPRLLYEEPCQKL